MFIVTLSHLPTLQMGNRAFTASGAIDLRAREAGVMLIDMPSHVPRLDRERGPLGPQFHGLISWVHLCHLQTLLVGLIVVEWRAGAVAVYMGECCTAGVGLLCVLT